MKENYYIVVQKIHSDAEAGVIPKAQDLVFTDYILMAFKSEEFASKVTEDLLETYEDEYFLNDIYKMSFKYKEITLNKGECLLLPSKWIYSIKATNETIIFNQTWDTYLNKIAHYYEFIKYNY